MIPSITEAENRWIYKRALKVALTCVLTLWIVKTFHFPYGEWAVLSVLIVSHLRFGLTFQKGINRIFGTIAGCVMGALVGDYIIHYHFSFIYTLPVWIFLAWYLAILSYGYVMFFGMIVLTCALSLMQSSGHSLDQLLLYRSINIILGVSMALISEVIWPQRQNYHDLIKHLNDNKQSLIGLIKFIKSAISSDSIDLVAMNNKLKSAAETQLKAKPLLTLIAHEPMHIGSSKNTLETRLINQRKILDTLSSLSLLFQLNKYSLQERALLIESLTVIIRILDGENVTYQIPNTSSIHAELSLISNLLQDLMRSKQGRLEWPDNCLRINS